MPSYKNILVVVDSLQPQQPVLAHAAKLATAHQGTLTIIDVVPEFSWTQRLLMQGTEHLRDLLARERGEHLKKLAASLGKTEVGIKTKVLVGNSAVEIIRQVLRGKHDLVMRTAKGHHSRRAGFFSSTSFELLRKCPCTVWLFKPGPIQIEQILAAVDATPDDERHAALNERILDTLQTIAKFEQASPHMAHVWSIYGERLVKDYMKTHEFAELETSLRAESEAALQKLAAQAGLRNQPEQVHLLRGEPHVEVPTFVKDHKIDLVVMGTVARRGLEGVFMGNTAELILNQVQCSVIAVKPDDFVCPVKRRSRATATKPAAK